MKKLSSNSMVPAKPRGGKAPSVTETPQQKVGAPAPDAVGKAGHAGSPPAKAKPQTPRN
ncbi:MAG: hypothetical protein Q7T86_01120 [Hyphomicrobiaceae bacterium]|nr:hypothetical protein [Hyphomicrobiaceae bacterium]